MRVSFLKTQVIPIALTAVACALLISLLYAEVRALDAVFHSAINLKWRIADVLAGLIIYLKTSIDFALYMGHLMSKNPGWKSRIAIEIGTALGNGAGTLGILALWAVCKEIKWLLACMVLLAAMVLFKLAEEGFEHSRAENRTGMIQSTAAFFERAFKLVNSAAPRFLSRIVPNVKLRGGAQLRFFPLFSFAFAVPFILGLDDFAGYVPLFNIVNVFGFAIGVFAGHMLLNMLLYLSPRSTMRAVSHPILSLLGSFVFAGLGIWGLAEVAHIIGI